MTKKRLLLSVSFAALLLGSATLSKPAYAEELLGGIDFDEECEWLFGNRGLHTGVIVLDPQDPYSWRCRLYFNSFELGYLRERGMDTNKACREQYGNDVYSRVTDSRSAASWRCFR